MTSPLKCQTRVVKCFHNGQGFGVASIEGRCAIRHAARDRDTSYAGVMCAVLLPGHHARLWCFLCSPQSFAFKCHRVQSSINAVNSIAFHPVHQDTFATCGADGGFVFWDKGRRKMLHQSQRLYAPVGWLSRWPDCLTIGCCVPSLV